MGVTEKRREPTKAQATKVLNALRRQCAAWIDEGDTGPELKRDWDWTGSGDPARWSIVWEEGPFQWSYLFPFGGRDEEFGFKLADVSDAVPEGFFVEAITSWAVALYEL